MSLRARLKRAAFFDKREREVAAGKADSVETDAGLPDAMEEAAGYGGPTRAQLAELQVPMGVAGAVDDEAGE